MPRVRLGTIPFLFGLRLPYTLPPPALGTHLHVMGLTGMGKSKLLASFAAQLISQGRACAVIDPHADLTQDILLVLLRQGYFRRPHALNKLLYVDFGRNDRFVPFNLLRSPGDPYQVARLLVEACTRAWPSLSGGAAPQFENLLLAATTVLIANHLPLTALTPLLTNAAYREQLVTRVADPLVTAFFRERYALGHGTGLSESTLRRAFLLSYPPPLRYSLGQPGNLLNFRSLMDRGVSVLCNLGNLDAETQRILGSLLTVGFESAALSRANQPPALRRPYHLVVDEFAQFAAQSETALENVLALTRKYRLFLVLAHQTWSQLSMGLRGAVQNTTFLSFRLGAEDAAWAAERIGSITPYQVKYQTPTHPVFVSQAEQRAQWTYSLHTLPPRAFYLRVAGRTIALRALTLPAPNPEEARQVAALCETYATRLLVPRERIPDVGAAEPDAPDDVSAFPPPAAPEHRAMHSAAGTASAGADSFADGMRHHVRFTRLESQKTPSSSPASQLNVSEPTLR